LPDAKSAVARPQERKFLGFTIAPKSLDRFKQPTAVSPELPTGVSDHCIAKFILRSGGNLEFSFSLSCKAFGFSKKCRPFRRLAAKSRVSGEEVRASRAEEGGVSLCSVIFQNPKSGWRPVALRGHWHAEGLSGTGGHHVVVLPQFLPPLHRTAIAGADANPKSFSSSSTTWSPI
jgi:hypothetical protein